MNRCKRIRPLTGLIISDLSVRSDARAQGFNLDCNRTFVLHQKTFSVPTEPIGCTARGRFMVTRDKFGGSASEEPSSLIPLFHQTSASAIIYAMNVVWVMPPSWDGQE